MGIFDGIKKRFKQVDEVKELKERIKSSPDNPSLHQRLAERLIKRGEFSEAITEYSKAASLFEKEGFGVKSIAVLKQCLKIDPTNIDTEMQLMSALIKNGLAGDAISEFQKIMGDIHFFPSGDKRDEFIRFSLDLIGDIPEIHTYLIKDCLNTKDSLGVISSVERAVPNIKSKRQLEGFHDFLESIEDNFDDFSGVWETYSLSLLACGLKEKGFHVLEKISGTIGQNDEAREAVELVKSYFQEVDSDSSFPKYLSNVSDYMRKLKEEEEEKDKIAESEVVEDEEEKEEEDFGLVLDKLREKVDSEIGDEDLNARYNLGIAFKEMGLFEEAIREFNVSNNDPDLYFASMLMLKDCFESIERYDEAITVIDELIERGGEDERVDLDLMYQKAEILYKSGELEEANDLYRHIYQTDESFRDVAAKVKDE